MWDGGSINLVSSLEKKILMEEKDITKNNYKIERKTNLIIHKIKISTTRAWK